MREGERERREGEKGERERKEGSLEMREIRRVRVEGTFATHTSELISTGIVIVKRSKKVVPKKIL